MNRTSIRWAHVVSVAALGCGLVVGAIALPASAAPATSTTQNFHQTWDLSQTGLGLLNPCNNDAVSGTARSNGVFHATSQGDGNFWATFTETDKVLATDAGTGETFSGEFTVWANFNLNQQNANFTFTANGRLRGDQGHTIGFHDVAHGTMTPSGQVTVYFDNPTLTCG